MRNFILLLLVAFALPVAAQKSNSVTFDFANPTSLDPQITPSDVNSGTVFVTDKVFHNSSGYVENKEKSENLQAISLGDSRCIY